MKKSLLQKNLRGSENIEKLFWEKFQKFPQKTVDSKYKCKLLMLFKPVSGINRNKTS